MGEDGGVSDARTEVDVAPAHPPEPAGPGPAGTTPAGVVALSRSQLAIAQYRRRMRRSGRIYAAVIVLVVAAIGAGVGIAWSRGEISHASLRTVSPAPPSIALATPSPAQRPAWRTTDRIALGTPQYGGTVITFSGHTVGGRDARTGVRTWAYTRTDRTVCTAAQLTNTTVAVYAVHGNCDELSAFDSGTGRRRWTRTLDKDGQPIDGRPTYGFTPFTFLVASPSTVYAIDPVTGLDRWTYNRYGCRIEHTALGSTGALISQTCSTRVKCTNVQFCARGPQVFLRDGSAGNGDDSDKNADHIKWLKRNDTQRPASADSLVSTVSAGGDSLQVLDANKGGVQRTVALRAGSGPLDAVVALATASDELIWLAGRTYAVAADRSTPDWSLVSPVAPTVAAVSGEDLPTLGSARIAVPVEGGIGLVDGTDGRVGQRFAVPVPAGSTVYSLGSGFVVAGPTGTTLYR
jgi:outer membrane protein assembly factor BamB